MKLSAHSAVEARELYTAIFVKKLHRCRQRHQSASRFSDDRRISRISLKHFRARDSVTYATQICAEAGVYTRIVTGTTRRAD